MKNFDFKEGEYLLIDKPKGWTSFDVVNKVRIMLKYEVGIPKIKVGHTGTLDPLATGLLVVCTGKFTKRISELTDLDKEYTGTIKIGVTTASFDLETGEDHAREFAHITTEDLERARKQFLGDIRQVPPVYSAKRIGGRKAYEYARGQEEVKMEPRQVTIHAFELTRVELPFIDFRVRCSKGTYIRSLANDFGMALQTGAYLSDLRRTAVGNFRIEDALTLTQFQALLR